MRSFVVVVDFTLRLKGYNMAYLVPMWPDKRSDGIDVNHIGLLCGWAKVFAVTQRDDKDVSDPLYRAVIGIYQFEDIWKHYHAKHYVKLEFEEAVGGFIFHTIAALEMINISIDLHLANREISTIQEWYEITIKHFPNETRMFTVAMYLRQMLYYVMNRKNRLNKDKLIYSAEKMIENIFHMCHFKSVNIPRGIQTAMLKLVDKEFTSH